MGCAGSSPAPSTCCCLINIHYTMRRISLDVSKEAVALGILEVLKVSPSDVPCASAYGSEKLPASDLVTVYPLPYQEDLRQMLFMTTGLFVALYYGSSVCVRILSLGSFRSLYSCFLFWCAIL